MICNQHWHLESKHYFVHVLLISENHCFPPTKDSRLRRTVISCCHVPLDSHPNQKKGFGPLWGIKEGPRARVWVNADAPDVEVKSLWITQVSSPQERAGDTINHHFTVLHERLEVTPEYRMMYFLQHKASFLNFIADKCRKYWGKVVDFPITKTATWGTSLYSLCILFFGVF